MSDLDQDMAAIMVELELTGGEPVDVAGLRQKMGLSDRRWAEAVKVLYDTDVVEYSDDYALIGLGGWRASMDLEPPPRPNPQGNGARAPHVETDSTLEKAARALLAHRLWTAPSNTEIGALRQACIEDARVVLEAIEHG